MNLLVLKICFMVFWVSTGIIRYPFNKKQKENKIQKDNKTTLEKTLLFGAFVGMMFIPLIYVFTPLFAFADYQLYAFLPYVGLALIPLTLWLFYRSHKDLGQNWSPSLEIREEHTLITNGVYQKIRHPMYTSIWLWTIIQICLLPNYIAGFAGIFFFGILYFLRVKQEEKMMLNLFGQDYQAYMNSTNRLIPKVFV